MCSYFISVIPNFIRLLDDTCEKWTDEKMWILDYFYF